MPRIASVQVPFSYGNDSQDVSTAVNGLPFRTQVGQDIQVNRVIGNKVLASITGCDQELIVPKVLLNKSERWK